MIGRVNRVGPAILAVISILLFWAIRIYYWSRTEEALFSDMADFQRMAESIRYHFVFQFDTFWWTLFTFSVGGLRALQMYLFGDSLMAWRFFQTTLLFVGLIWLARELKLHTRSAWLAAIFLFVVAVSKPSVFWSFKLARESLGEGFGYLVCASFLCALRTRKPLLFFLAGFIFIAALHVRGTLIFAAPFLVGLIFIFRPRVDHRHPYSQPLQLAYSRRAVLAAFFCLGVAVIQIPWMIRCWTLYRAPVVLSLNAPYVFFWDLGALKVDLPEGGQIHFTTFTLLGEAPVKFKTDYEAYLHAQRLFKLWVSQNRDKIPGIVWHRWKSSVIDPNVHLTSVPRDALFGTWVDKVLIDKSPWLVITGVIGLFMGVLFIDRTLAIVMVCGLLPWLHAAAMIGYARMLESSLTTLFFGNVLLIMSAWRLLLMLRYRGQATLQNRPLIPITGSPA